MSEQRIDIIDYLKAIAIIFVIVNHANILSKTNPIFLYMIDVAVPIFLILSGYVYCFKEWNNELLTNYRRGKLLKQIKRFTTPLVPALFAYSFYELKFKNINVWGGKKNKEHYIGKLWTGKLLLLHHATIYTVGAHSKRNYKTV